ncbi:MAG: hypothetical protein EOO38_11030 [Cytophagaceae bacterium]|nr:MAG: hypothetical protein EOO38_11030 [Cytophagaceae bacterium]
MTKVGDTGYLKSDPKKEDLLTVSDIAYNADHGCTYLYFWGQTRESENGWEVEYFIPANDELAELKRWKEYAIARFPDLAKPETDEHAAGRFADKAIDTGAYYDTFIEAFAWARENAR